MVETPKPEVQFPGPFPKIAHNRRQPKPWSEEAPGSTRRMLALTCWLAPCGAARAMARKAPDASQRRGHDAGQPPTVPYADSAAPAQDNRPRIPL